VSVYPSAPGPLSHQGGEELLNTGLLDTDPRTSLPSSASVTFTKAGSYTFICTVHGPSMKGRIDVG
jgi:plastocyanin